MPYLLWARLLIKFEFTGVTDLCDHRAFNRVTLLGEGHLASDAIEVLDLCQRIAHASPICSDITCDLAAILDSLLDDEHRVPGECADIIRYIAMFVIIAIDELFRRACGSCGGIVCAEELPLAVITAKIH